MFIEIIFTGAYFPILLSEIPLVDSNRFLILRTSKNISLIDLKKKKERVLIQRELDFMPSSKTNNLSMEWRSEEFHISFIKAYKNEDDLWVT